MPTEYTRLVDALKQTGIPFAEYGWNPRPENAVYGVVALDTEPDSLDGDGEKLDRAWEASVDVFFPQIAQRNNVVMIIENAIRSVCGSSWDLNSIQHERDTGLFHYEWICEGLY